MFWENFINECSKKGYKPSRLLAEINVSKGNMAKWKSDSCVPSGEILIKIANKLEVSIDYLLGQNMPSEVNSEGHDEKADEVLSMYSRLSDEAKKQALSYLEYLAEHKAHEET